MRNHGDIGSIQPPHNIPHMQIARIEAQTHMRVSARRRQIALLVMKRGPRQPGLDVQGRFLNFAV